jgi:hypothetical protein
MGNTQSCCKEFASPTKERRFSMFEYSRYPWDPMEWEIKEWHTDLRENEILLHEQNLNRVIKIRREQEEKDEVARKQREKQIEERENELKIKKEELEKKDLEIEEKVAMLEIAIRVNELNTKCGVWRYNLESWKLLPEDARDSHWEATLDQLIK